MATYEVRGDQVIITLKGGKQWRYTRIRLEQTIIKIRNNRMNYVNPKSWQRMIQIHQTALKRLNAFEKRVATKPVHKRDE